MTKIADEVLHRHFPEEDFKPGVYRHWKGGLYHAVALGWANEVLVELPDLAPTMARSLRRRTSERVVIYLSMTTGEWHTRPLNSDYKDAWNDTVFHDNAWKQRFCYVGVQPIPT